MIDGPRPPLGGPLAVCGGPPGPARPLLIPDSESERITAVRRYDVLDTPADDSFDRVTALAAKHFGVPIAVVSIVDTDRIWFKSRYGLNGVEQIGRDPGLCASAILGDEAWVVENARVDPRALANPLVAGNFGLRFYAGAPLRTGDGHNLGTLCVIDRRPREFTPEQAAVLKDMAAIVVDELELRLAAMRTIQHERQLRLQAERDAVILQQSLLPPALPEPKGIEVAAVRLEAGRGLVAGEFHDCFALATGDGDFGLLVGEIAADQREPSCAAGIAVARYTIRRAALTARSPGEALEALHRVFFVGEDEGVPGRRCGVLLVFARLVPGGVELTAAGAGNPPAIIVRYDRSLVELAPGGKLAGWYPDVSFAETSARLQPGDTMLLHTRGLSEADSRTGESDPHPMRRLLVAERTEPQAGALLARLQSAVKRGELPLGSDADAIAIHVVGRV